MLTEHHKPHLNVRALAAALLAGLLTANVAAGAIKVGDTFPDLASFKIEGKLPESLKDKVVMIDFWASWCDPCKESFPAMEDLQKRLGPKGLVIIAINVDEDRKEMEDFLKKNAPSASLPGARCDAKTRRESRRRHHARLVPPRPRGQGAVHPHRLSRQ